MTDEKEVDKTEILELEKPSNLSIIEKTLISPRIPSSLVTTRVDESDGKLLYDLHIL